MSGKDQSVMSKEALMSTKPGKQIMKQALFKSKGYKLFNHYKEETEKGKKFCRESRQFATSGRSHRVLTSQCFSFIVGATARREFFNSEPNVSHPK